MTAAEILARLDGAGIQIRADSGRLIAAPRERLTDELRALIRTNKAALLAVLAHTPEHAYAHGPAEHPGLAPAPMPAPDRGTDCMRCAHLAMRVETHHATRRVFWWRCAKEHALLEGRNFGERVLLAPAECDVAGDFKQWQAGQR